VGHEEDERVRRDRKLQEKFRQGQAKLQELLDGKRTVATAGQAASVDVSQYDPQTAGLIRLGLIIPKWNISHEVTEHYGAPGEYLTVLFIIISISCRLPMQKVDVLSRHRLSMMISVLSSIFSLFARV